ncbi:MAG: hypothetical protein KAS97_04395 [Candidatus Aminicenantes bacterium]|nr:hypothetical protein [Candidatus Aminicenantes bacterium]
MFKSKKNRDSALLIFMALVTVAFLLYLFFPSNGKTGEKDKIPVKHIKKNSEQISVEKVEERVENKFGELRDIFKTYFNEVNTGDRVISRIPSEKLEETLRSVLMEKFSEEIGRSLKYRFRDINRAVDIFKDSDLSNIEKFDMYIALFLIKAANEDIIGRSINFTTDEIMSLLNLKHYELINNEASENYHAIPVIIYADLLIKKTDIFSPGEEIILFSKILTDIGDISPMQHINSIKDIFNISTELRRFSFSWVERDALDPDDKGSYKNVPVRRRKFFKLQYLIFPDPGKGGDLTWLKDLINADSGAIELSEIKIADETPGENYSAKSIIYSESTSRFIFIMDSPSFVSERGYISIMMNEKMKRLNSENTIINFAEKLYSKKEFRKKMNSFGKFLYRIRSVF